MQRTAATLLILASFLALSVPTSGWTVPVPESTPLDVVIENGEYTFTTQLTVPPGGSLTIRNSVVWFDFIGSCRARGGNLGDDCDGAIEVNGGRLYLINSTFDTHLESHPDDYTRPYILRGKSAYIHIDNSTLYRMRRSDFQLPGPEPSIVKNSQFIGGRIGPKFHRGAEAVIENNYFDGLYDAVKAYDSSAIIRNNHFRNITHYGMDVEISIVGDKAFHDTLVLVEGNLVEDSLAGMLNLHGDKNTIRNNVFRNNDVGIVVGLLTSEEMIRRETPTITGNVLDGNDRQVYYYPQTTDAPIEITATLSGNSFLNTVCNDIHAREVPNVEIIVHAEGNWWGSTDGPQDRSEECPAFLGTATFYADPWLTGPPS